MTQPRVNRSAWGGAAISEADAHRWIAAGITDPADAVHWRIGGIEPEQAGAWIAAGMNPGGARRWRDFDVTRPQDRPEGFVDPGPWHFVTEHDLPRDIAWGDLFGVTSAEIAQLGYRHGQTPEAIRVVSAVLSVQKWPRPPARRVPDPDDQNVRDFYLLFEDYPRAVLTDLRTVADLDWFDVAACVATGMTVAQARKHITDGADVSGFRMLLALAR